MTQDEYEVGSLENAEKFAIIRMAQQAGIAHAAGIYMEHLERFYELAFAAGAAHEREKQAEQEPVAWKRESDGALFSFEVYDGLTPLYAAPVHTKDLTDDEKWAIFTSKDWTGEPLNLIDAVIAADREKNRG